MGADKEGGSVPSTGKSSNSSSSSSAAGGFCWSLSGAPEGGSVVVALVVVDWPSAASDIFFLLGFVFISGCLYVYAPPT